MIDAAAFKEFCMKKILIVCVLLVVGLAGAFANGRGELTTIEGKLTVHESLPAVETKDGLWMLAPGAFYRAAWEHGISEGDTLVIQGFTDPDSRFEPGEFAGRIMPVEVAVNGKDIDIDRTGVFGRRGSGRGGYGPGYCEPFGDRRFRDGGGPRNGDGNRSRDGTRSRGGNR
jgi:hypothetical protein